MYQLKKQFIGHTFGYTLLSIFFLHLIAIFTRNTSVEPFIMVLIAIITVVIAWKSLPNGLLIAFSEIFVGGHGHLFDMSIYSFSLSLRMVIFFSVITVWLIKILKKDIKINYVFIRDFPWLIISVSVLIGTVIGLMTNNPLNAFDDANVYMIILYLLPVISIDWTNKLKRDLLQILFASFVWIIGFTMLLSYLFTHLDTQMLSQVYEFVRDSRLAEITIQVANEGFLSNIGIDYWYRIFMQSQFFVLVGGLLFFSAGMFAWRDQRTPILVVISVIGSVIALLLGMSRSFLLGYVIAALFILVSALKTGKNPLKNVFKRLLLFVQLLLVGASIAVLTVVIPIPKQSYIDTSIYSTNSKDSSRSTAIVSRWSLLTPMMTEIAKSPLIGFGFGKEITYKSMDPRIKEETKSGDYTTYRFEWGYQDIWLKMGILGLLGFATYFIIIILAVKDTAKRHGYAWIVVGLGSGIIALFVTNIFSPYLNHPIGLGYMIFILPFIDWQKFSKKTVEINKNKKVRIEKLKMQTAVLKNKI